MEENLWKISLSGNSKKSLLDVLCSKLLICTEKKNKTNKRNILSSSLCTSSFAI